MIGASAAAWIGGGVLASWGADLGDFARATVWTAATHWFPVALVALMIAALAGSLGRGLGVHNLFRDDAALLEYNRQHWTSYIKSPTIGTPAAIMVQASFVWAFAFLLGDDLGPPASLDGFVPRVSGQIVLTAAAVVLAAIRWRGARLSRAQRLETWRVVLGTAIGTLGGLALLELGLRLGALIGPGPADAMAGLGAVAAVIVVVALYYRTLIAAISLVSAVSLVALGYVAVASFPDGAQILPLVVAVLWLVWANGGRRRGTSVPLKMQFPGIVQADGTSHYAPGAAVHLGDFFDSENPRYKRPPDPAALDLRASLEAWAVRARAAQGVTRPKMVVIATSGGAYRAAFWTGLVLDRLAAEEATGALPGFSSAVRLITGASGGMVGAAYFAARARSDGGPNLGTVSALEADILGVQRGDLHPGYPYSRRWAIPRDSLSAVAQQLVQRDLPGLMSGRVVTTDRGTVLEDQWHTLDVDFAHLGVGEAAGWRPSLVFSPMLAETGQPLVISNLDMARAIQDRVRASIGLTKNEVVEFFDLFPASRGTFKLKTAVRMNAAFPYISPDTALPTDPYRRVVDAGYYDNYGVDLAAAFLDNAAVRDWVLEECSGVAVVQIRAFAPPRPDAKDPEGMRRALQWLTTPLDAVLTARSATQLYRNRQTLQSVENAYNDATPGFFYTIALQADCATSLNWYMPADEFAALSGEIAPVALAPDLVPSGVPKLSQQAQNQYFIDKLRAFWGGPRADPTGPGAGI